MDMPELYVGDLTFRVLSSTDLEWFLAIRNSSRAFLHDDTEFSIQETREWFESGHGGNQYFIVESSNSKLGYLRVSNIGSKVTLIGLDIAEEFRGFGLAPKIYGLFAKEYSQKLLTECVGLRVLKSNTRAINLYRKLGFSIIEETNLDFYMEVQTIDLFTFSPTQ